MPEPNALLRGLVHATGFDQLRHGPQRVLGVGDHLVYHGALVGVEEAGLEATQAPGFLDHEVDVTGVGEEVGGLLVYRF